MISRNGQGCRSARTTCPPMRWTRWAARCRAMTSCVSRRGEQVPCINNYGYYLSGGAWRDSSGAAAEPALSLYQHVQYAQLFDPKRRIDAQYEPLA